jgi:hypothetical protein
METTMSTRLVAASGQPRAMVKASFTPLQVSPEVALWEISFVTWGADPLAKVIGVDDDRLILAELEAQARALKRRLDWQGPRDVGGFARKLRLAEAELVALGGLSGAAP